MVKTKSKKHKKKSPKPKYKTKTQKTPPENYSSAYMLLKGLIIYQAMLFQESLLVVYQQIPEFPYFETMF